MSLIASLIVTTVLSTAPMTGDLPVTLEKQAPDNTVLADNAPMVGEVTYYAGPKEGRTSLMQRVWNWRLWKGHVPECPDCLDAVALLEPQYIGKKVWLRHPDGEVVGPLMVVDCAEAKHRPNLRKRGWVADISYELAMKWSMAGPLEGVTVLFEAPAGPTAAGWLTFPLAVSGE